MSSSVNYDWIHTKLGLPDLPDDLYTTEGLIGNDHDFILMEDDILYLKQTIFKEGLSNKTIVSSFARRYRFNGQIIIHPILQINSLKYILHIKDGKFQRCISTK